MIIGEWAFWVVSYFMQEGSALALPGGKAPSAKMKEHLTVMKGPATASPEFVADMGGMFPRNYVRAAMRHEVVEFYAGHPDQAATDRLALSMHGFKIAELVVEMLNGSADPDEAATEPEPAEV